MDLPYQNAYILRRSEPFIKHAYLTTAVTASIGGGGAVKGANSITLTAGQGALFSVGDAITFDYCGYGCTENDIFTIVAKAGDTLKFASLIGHDYPAGAEIVKVLHLISSIPAGTIDSPVSMSISPPDGINYVVTNIILHAESVLQPTLNNFFGIAGLANGMCIVHRDGEISSKVTIRTNSDMFEYFGNDNVGFIEKAPAGTWAINAMFHVPEHTDGCFCLSSEDMLEFVFFDDVSTVLNGEIIVQGYALN